MNRRKQALLFFLSLLLLAAFFLLPPNREWGNKVMSYAREFETQRKLMSLEERKLNRYGAPYRLSTEISDFFRLKGIQENVLVLVPSTAYFQNYKMDYHVPEPAVFYYLTGLKTVWSNSPEAAKADWVVGIANGKLAITPAGDKKVLHDSIRVFNKFPPGL